MSSSIFFGACFAKIGLQYILGTWRKRTKDKARNGIVKLQETAVPKGSLPVMNRITQDIKSLQFLIEHAKKLDVCRASRRYNLYRFISVLISKIG